MLHSCAFVDDVWTVSTVHLHLPYTWTNLPDDMPQLPQLSQFQSQSLPQSLPWRWSHLLELGLLAVAALPLYFPDRLPSWAVPVAFALLVASWGVRRWSTGRWWTGTAADWPLWFWVGIMLPIAIWAAPPQLRTQYAWPRSYIMLWDFALLAALVAHTSRSRRLWLWALGGMIGLTQAIALIAPLGMERRSKFPIVGPILDLIPAPLTSVFSGAEGGFSTNQLAGVLLLVLPLLLAICVAGWRARGWVWWLALLTTVWMLAVMVLAQSRGGIVGLGVGVLALLILRLRHGWRRLMWAGVLLVGLVVLLPSGWLNSVGDAPVVEAVGGMTTLQDFRTQVWGAAMQGMQDFFFTGMGFGTFRRLVFVLYPLPGIPSSMDLAHAHNFFLQTGLDFGVPGLIAVLAIYLIVVALLVRVDGIGQARPVDHALPWLTWHVVVIGLMGSWVAQSIYSMFDAVSVGSKPSFLWWWFVALVLAAGNLADEKPAAQGAAELSADGDDVGRAVDAAAVPLHERA